ncbi:MAG: outer membrane beta-barrel domain-containing protein [Syntrophobacterales bacterium]|nr:outer membrane beta-barrel domain-containing protein [Syntrophobacterales bacterium]
MKKMVLGVAVLLLLVFAATGMAEVKAGSLSITPYIGGYRFEGNMDVENGPVFGLRGGYNFTKNAGLEGYFHYVKAEFKGVAGNPDMKLLGYGIDGLYHFLPGNRLVPFLAAGVGMTHYDPEIMNSRNKLTINYGGGLKYFLTDNVALRADLRHVLPINGRYNDLLYTIGVTFAFGGAKETPAPAAAAKPAPAPVAPAAPAAVVIGDSDNDGVLDNQDKCPGTPAGVKVDAVGCPLDADGDGVYDYLDKCPGTPAGVKVDAVGCPLDADGDGVYDYLDRCPGTPAGVKVDAVGCPPPAPATPKEKAIIEKGRVTLNVEFDFDKAVVKKQYYNEINELATVLKKYPELKIAIEGHTDSIGKAAYNEKLSQRRAEAVMNYLIKQSEIAAARLSAKGYGEARPIASNATKAGRQKNRRVEAAAEYIIKK